MRGPETSQQTSLEKRIAHCDQLMLRAKRRKYRLMNSLQTSSIEIRRKRTRSLIQLGGLVEKAGLIESFGIVVGEDLQKSPQMKEPVAALFKGFLVLNEMVQSDEVHLGLWASQGLELLAKQEKE